ncbi:hypothetical protein PGT21_014776 [Puccinia graminis f. sp. tritici]|uniref:Uncharacterized protein n=1 Tax=Puccinia graminis f. sp. tritici TaxID=56615 RepID=A0A5B0NV09_PUCGR|nr:hypothetical protein PGTUg99_005560 [Puccinia graminis f. sp. tritici]KAA1092813.1 hypothetical protein PGT21_014776 [Puccinia graminis f. sp. tritici]
MCSSESVTYMQISLRRLPSVKLVWISSKSIDGELHCNSPTTHEFCFEHLDHSAPPLSTANWLFSSPRTPSSQATLGHLR